MMICKADFEELFPHIFRPDPAPAASPDRTGLNADRSGRMDDPGDRPLPATRQSRAALADGRDLGHDIRGDALAAMLPATAAYAAAWTMLSAYGR